jgi:hypothetical protein
MKKNKKLSLYEIINDNDNLLLEQPKNIFKNILKNIENLNLNQIISKSFKDLDNNSYNKNVFQNSFIGFKTNFDNYKDTIRKISDLDNKNESQLRTYYNSLIKNSDSLIDSLNELKGMTNNENILKYIKYYEEYFDKTTKSVMNRMSYISQFNNIVRNSEELDIYKIFEFFDEKITDLDSISLYEKIVAIVQKNDDKIPEIDTFFIDFFKQEKYDPKIKNMDDVQEYLLNNVDKIDNIFRDLKSYKKPNTEKASKDAINQAAENKVNDAMKENGDNIITVDENGNIIYPKNITYEDMVIFGNIIAQQLAKYKFKIKLKVLGGIGLFVVLVLGFNCALNYNDRKKSLKVIKDFIGDEATKEKIDEIEKQLNNLKYITYCFSIGWLNPIDMTTLDNILTKISLNLYKKLNDICTDCNEPCPCTIDDINTKIDFDSISDDFIKNIESYIKKFDSNIPFDFSDDEQIEIFKTKLKKEGVVKPNDNGDYILRGDIFGLKEQKRNEIIKEFEYYFPKEGSPFNERIVDNKTIYDLNLSKLGLFFCTKNKNKCIEKSFEEININEGTKDEIITSIKKLKNLIKNNSNNIILSCDGEGDDKSKIYYKPENDEYTIVENGQIKKVNVCNYDNESYVKFLEQKIKDLENIEIVEKEEEKEIEVKKPTFEEFVKEFIKEKPNWIQKWFNYCEYFTKENPVNLKGGYDMYSFYLTYGKSSNLPYSDIYKPQEIKDSPGLEILYNEIIKKCGTVKNETTNQKLDEEIIRIKSLFGDKNLYGNNIL